MQALTNKLSGLTLTTVTNVPWYKRLEMAIRVAVQLKELHDSGRVHRNISVQAIVLNEKGQANLSKSPEEASTDEITTDMCCCGDQYFSPERRFRRGYSASYTFDDVYALGSAFYELFYGQKPSWTYRPASVHSVEVRQELLHEHELLADNDAVKFLTYWMCHPEPKMRPTMRDVCELLKAISENDHTVIYPYTPESLPEKITSHDEMERLFQDCVYNAYVSRKISQMDLKIIFLTDLIILLPRKSKLDSNGSIKNGRSATVLHKIDGRWHESAAFALSSNDQSPHGFKCIEKKERVICDRLKDADVVPRHIITLTFADKPDKILSLYEQAVDLFTHVHENKLDDEARVALACDLIDAVDKLQRAGFFHRDLKLENVLVDDSGRILFCDLDKMVQNRLWQYIVDRVGTPEYVPPERYNPSYAGSWEPHEVYGLGCTLLPIVVEDMLLLPWDRENCSTEEESLQARWDYEQTSDSAIETMKYAYDDPLLLLEYLASWMVHPDKTKRASWDDVMKVRAILKK